MMVLVIAASMTAVLLLSPTIQHDLTVSLGKNHLLIAGIGLLLHLVGCVAPQPFGHLCLILGGGSLMWASWVCRHWRWGWLIWSGIGCNSLAIAWHGRMPVHVQTIAALGLTLPTGTIIPGSKDVVADGWLAWWLGDRFVVSPPFLHYPLVWSIGDGMLLAGICLVVLSTSWHRLLIVAAVWRRLLRPAIKDVRR